MTLLPVNADQHPDAAALAAAQAALPAKAPVVIMIHGYRFNPTDPGNDPHRHILSLAPEIDCWKAVSWPRHLGLRGNAGLAIAYGWNAQGTIWAAMATARHTAQRLARLIAMLRQVAPARPIHLIGHSLGARVALLALEEMSAGDVQRAVLISAAAFRDEARRVLQSPGGQGCEIINVTGRENLLFNGLLRLAAPLGGPTLARGPDAPNWLDIRLDMAQTLAALARIGHRIPPPRARVCHWSGYLRPGVFGFYRALLLAPNDTPLTDLRRALPDPAINPRTRFLLRSGISEARRSGSTGTRTTQWESRRFPA